MATHYCTSRCVPVCTQFSGTVAGNSTTPRAFSWNGPMCPVCSKCYVGQHECSPADILRKIADLYDRLPKTVRTDALPTGLPDRCPCNPNNGGSGVCGCTLSGPTITCNVA